MKLFLFVGIYNRKLVKSATSDFPVDLPTLFREDWIDLEITLVEPSGTITSPQTVVDVSSTSIKAAIGQTPRSRLDSAPRLRFTRRVKITELTDQLIASYASVGGINHLDGTNLPSKSGIAGLNTDLL